MMVEGDGFEPSKAEPSDLQSDPFGHSGTPPQGSFYIDCYGIKQDKQSSCNDGGGGRIRTIEGSAVRFTV